MRWRLLSRVFVLAVLAVQPVLWAGNAVEDTVRETILRLKAEQPADTLLGISAAEVAGLLTPEEAEVLGGSYLTFTVDRPATVYVAAHLDAFWLSGRGFEKTAEAIRVNDKDVPLWRKDFEAGPVGLGVNSLTDDGDHYFVVVLPREGAGPAKVADIAPAQHTAGVAAKGEYVLSDEDDELIVALPESLTGQVLIRGCGNREEDAFIAGYFRKTDYAPKESPSQCVLTLPEDPRTAMTVQWSTSTAVDKGIVRYRKENAHEAPAETTAQDKNVEDLGLLNDAVIRRHEVTLTSLEPGTAYAYSVGDGTHWSEWRSFSTAPSGPEEFSFLYMGDIQVGYDLWDSVKAQALEMRPEAAFCLSAGDQVNRGGYRDDWDAWFHHAESLFSEVPITPVVGNHELFRGVPGLYLDLMDLPENGPANITPERAYAFEYGQALIVALDANLPPEEQADWLDARLGESKAVWKFVLFHQPIYSSKPNRDNPHLRDVWMPIFDKHGVDVVFQGHDHGYLRTAPMRGNEKAAEGTVYLVTVSGAKLYPVAHPSYAECVMEKTPTFQVIDIQRNPDRLAYHAYDADGKERDSFVIEK